MTNIIDYELDLNNVDEEDNIFDSTDCCYYDECEECPDYEICFGDEEV